MVATSLESELSARKTGRVRYLLDLFFLTGAEAYGIGLRFAVIISIRVLEGLQPSGLYIYGMALGIIFSMVADAGQMQFMTRALAYDPEQYRSLFGRAFYMRVYGNLTLLTLYALYRIVIADFDKLNIIVCCIITAGILGLMETAEGVWLSLGRSEKAAKMRAGIMTFIYAVPLMLYLGRVISLDVMVLLQALTGIISIAFYFSRITGMYGRTETAVISIFFKQLRESWILGLNQLLIVVSVQSPIVMIRWLMDTTSVGIYGIIQRVSAIVEIVLINFFKLTFPRFSRNFSGVAGSSHTWKTVWVLTVIFVFLAACCVAALTASAPWISRIFLGSYLARAIPIITLAALAMGFSLIKRPLYIALLASKREKLVTLVSGSAVAIIVSGTLSLMPVMGLSGAATAWLVAEIMSFVVMGIAGIVIHKKVLLSEEKTA